MADKIDLTVFEELKTALGTEEELYTLVFALCSDYVSDYIDDIFEECDYDEIVIKTNEILDSFGYEHIQQVGGGEGSVGSCNGVFKLRDKIYKAEYSYYSYNGDDYAGITDTLKVVTSKEKLITIYE